MTPDPEESIRCSLSCCSCVCFRPGSVQLRSCDRCGHGWLAHALEKLQAQPPSSCGPVEVALPGLVFDLSSLVLYGAQAIPVRLKILLDRLYSILTPEQVGHILHALGWNLGDYVRGYMLQSPTGKVLEHWFMVTPDEEVLIFEQFLRFGETRPIVELMLQCADGAGQVCDPDRKPAQRSRQSSTNGATTTVLKNLRGDSRLVASVCPLERSSPADLSSTVHRENLPGGLSFLLPFHFPNSAFRCLVPPTKELVPPSKLTPFLRRSRGSKLAGKHKQEGGIREKETNRILHQSGREAELKIKADPDRSSPPCSLWHPSFHGDRDCDLQRGTPKQENSFSLPPALNSSPILSSSSVYQCISPSSSSQFPISQKVHCSHSSSLHPLPSFSSSFLCPLPTTSLSSSLPPLSSSSSSLHPLPSSLCSVPSASTAGGRKGRVCCGVCGKSFYDKGTLKIHYNAVHLKIKHRCTVAGCTMVFSSLRSRNRHSANPNPRLHTGTSRDAYRNTHCDHTSVHSETHTHQPKQARRNIQGGHAYVCRLKEITNVLWKQSNDADAEGHAHTVSSGLSGHTDPQQGCHHSTPHHADSPPLPSHPLSQSSNTFTLNNPQALPPLPLHLRPVGSASPPSLIPAVNSATDKTERPLLASHAPCTTPVSLANCDSQVTSHCCKGKRWQSESAGPVPKKKPRKSSMPVKIERETLERRRHEDEEC